MRGKFFAAAFLLAFAIGSDCSLFAQSEVPQDAKARGDSKTLFGEESKFGDAPTFIKSDTLTLKGEDRVFVYDGNVEVKQGDMTLTSQSLEGKYSEDNKIQELIALNNVVVLKGPDIRATSNRAVYNDAAQTITLTESPELQQEGSVLTADQIIIYLQENRSVAQGAVRVKLVQKAGTGKTGSAGISALTGR